MFSSLLILFILPFLGRFKTKSSKFTKITQFFYWCFVTDVLLLGLLGACVVEQPYIIISQISAIFYFFYFLIILPTLEFLDKKVINDDPDLFYNLY
jgi:quinol-cytochrome oxidoreductase complex cytochrome b subunit